MDRKLISSLISVLVFLSWVLALPVVEADREGSQQARVSQMIQADQHKIQVEQQGRPGLTYHVISDQPDSKLAAVNARPMELTRGDFDEDGRADLLTIYVGGGAARLSLRFGDARGGFSDARSVDLPGVRPTALAVEDVNLDGHLDVVVAFDDLDTLSLLEGTGNGSFQPVKQGAVGSGVQALAAADFDKDGYVDLAVASVATSSIALLRGNGDGFESSVPLYTWPAGAVPEPVAMQAVDLDKDGLSDLILLNRHDLEVLSAAQAYEPVTYATAEGEFTAMTLGDFNLDELTDMVVSDTSGDLKVLLGNPVRTLSAPLTSSIGMPVKALAVAQLNEDGKPDLVLIGESRDNVTLLLGDGRGKFRVATDLQVQSGPAMVMAWRLNKDAVDDLVIATDTGGAVTYAVSAAPAIVVNTTRDVMDVPANAQVTQLPGPDKLVSLREAIIAANNTPGPQDIAFNIPKSDAGFDGKVFRMAVNSALPTLTGGGTAIDATTQTLATGDTNPLGPEVVLDGRSAGRIVDGLTVTSSLNVVRGLVINNFSGSGVKIVGAAIQNLVIGNYIGTDETGAQARPNQFYGVIVASNGSQANLIGGTAAEDRNLISGNQSHGIALNFPTFDNRIVGNYIGTNAAGTAPVPNGGNGIFLASVRENLIGGTTPGSLNLISGNGRNGVSIESGLNNQVLGNSIGVDVTGTQALPNGLDGVIVSSGSDTTLIGGLGPFARNLISSNMLNGIEVSSNSLSTNIQGNFIGTDKTGTHALGNAGNGVMVNAARNQVGGTIPQAKNIISSNGRNGVSLGSGTNQVGIVGNYIGVDATGVAALPNGGDGVSVIESTDNTLGGSTANSGNIISANGGNGIGLFRANNNHVTGNFIGTDAGAIMRLGNGNDGVRIQDSIGNLVEKNTISSSGRSGIGIIGASQGNRITHNSIFDNGGLGIDLNDDGVTFNDSSDLDSGPNDLRNFPIITSVTETGGAMMIRGVLPSQMPNLQTIELYRAMPDQSGYGEGGKYLSETKPDTDGNFTIMMPGPSGDTPLATALSNGDQLTALATDIQGNTSEFSPNFTIGIGDAIAPVVTLYSPNGGELINAGDTMTIKWRSYDNIGVVAQDILLTTDGGKTYRPLRTNLAGSIQQIQVQLPVVIDTAQAKICVVVRDGNSNTAQDCSDDFFVIYGRDVFPPTVAIVSPSGGEIIAAGQPYTIRWTATDDHPGVSSTVQFSTDGGATFSTLVSGLTSTQTDQSYVWKVPANLGTTQARIRVVAVDSAGMSSQAESNANFAIDKTAPVVRVGSPNGGELIIRLGLPVHIEWSSSDDVAVATQDVLVSYDAGKTFTPIVTNLSGSAHSYDWMMPHGTKSSKSLFRVVSRDFVGRTSYDDSDRTLVLIRP
jgi:hypothetical protein